VILSSCVGHTD